MNNDSTSPTLTPASETVEKYPDTLQDAIFLGLRTTMSAMIFTCKLLSILLLLGVLLHLTCTLPGLPPFDTEVAVQVGILICSISFVYEFIRMNDELYDNRESAALWIAVITVGCTRGYAVSVMLVLMARIAEFYHDQLISK